MNQDTSERRRTGSPDTTARDDSSDLGACEIPPAAPTAPTNVQVGADGRGDGSPTPPIEGVGGDSIDLESLRLTQDFGAAAGVKKFVRVVPVKKPSKE
jgi:hypothetical protein